MIKIFQEYSVDNPIPKLSQTPLYRQFDETSHISQAIIDELKHSQETVVKAEDISDILSLIRLNGDAIAKKAVGAYQAGKIVIIHNKGLSKVPPSLPYLISGKGDMAKAYIFADKAVNNIKATNEYTTLMAMLEAAYLALVITVKPSLFLMNRQLMLTLCNIYTLMAITPLEQRLYMKGDNLVKAMLYVVVFFYRMIDGDNVNEQTLPYKRIIQDKIDPGIVSQIIEDVKTMEGNGFMDVLNLIKKVNPVRYKDIDQMYMSYFIATCGMSLIFALENIPYLFMLITSANYKTQITAYGLNKVVTMAVKKVIDMMASTNLNLE